MLLRGERPGLHYTVDGHGAPLLLLNGYRLSGDSWPAEFVAILARERRVIALDNRGTGRSTASSHPFSLSELADDAVEVIDHLGLENADILGFSMGGAIAQELACNRPGRVRRLVLCATWSGRSHSRFADFATLCLLQDVTRLEPATAARRLWSVTYAPAYLDRHADEAEAQLQRELRYPTPELTSKLQYRAIGEFDAWHHLGEVKLPCLVIAGREDRLVPPENAAILAERLPNAELQLIPGLGHRLIWENPSGVARRVNAFLADGEAP